MQDRIDTLLREVGLSQNEVKVYLAALEQGEMSVTELARAARVHRVAAYALIEGLVQKGLLGKNGQRHACVISAKHPKAVEQLLRKERRRLRRVSESFDSLLPDLVSLARNASHRPSVQFFEGLPGLEQVNNDIIDTLKDLPPAERITLSYSNPSDIADRFDDYLYGTEGYIPNRIAYGIHNQVIALDSPVTQEIRKRDEEELREMVVLPKEVFPFRNDMTIYANKMALMGFQKEWVGVIIESKEIVDDQRAIFALSWMGANAYVCEQNLKQNSTS